MILTLFLRKIRNGAVAKNAAAPFFYLNRMDGIKEKNALFPTWRDKHLSLNKKSSEKGEEKKSPCFIFLLRRQKKMRSGSSVQKGEHRSDRRFRPQGKKRGS